MELFKPIQTFKKITTFCFHDHNTKLLLECSSYLMAPPKTYLQN